MTSPDALETVELELESEAVLDAWRDLFWRCPDATVFQHPAWLGAWRAHLGRDVVPVLVGVRAGGVLIGLAALGLREGVLGWMGGDITDYAGVLAIPSARDAVASALLDHVARDPRWARCELARLELTSPLLDPRSPPSLAITKRPQDACPYVPIPRGARALRDVLPSGFAKRVARSIQTAERAGSLSRTWAGPDDVLEHLETFFALHSAWWAARGEEGVMASASVRSFWRAAAPPLAREGVLRVVVLTLDAAPIASVLAFAHGGRFFSYLGGASPEVATLSPGRVAIAALVARAIAEEAHEVDFLRGVEPYKYDWGARDRWTMSLVIERR